MQTFKDNRDRPWSFAIHVAAARRVRDRLGVNLYGLVDDGFGGLAKLLGDPIDLVDVLYVLCQEQAERDHVTDEDFGRAMYGDALERGADAFLAELTDFFPNPRVRAGLTTVFTKSRAVEAKMRERAEAVLAAIDPDAEATRLSGSSGDSPGPSASTPDPSPSASST